MSRKEKLIVQQTRLIEGEIRAGVFGVLLEVAGIPKKVVHLLHPIQLVLMKVYILENYLFFVTFYFFIFLIFYIELEQRLDYVLRAGGLGRNYLYTVRAHTAYWNNYDVAYFVLTKLFPNLET